MARYSSSSVVSGSPEIQNGFQNNLYELTMRGPARASEGLCTNICSHRQDLNTQRGISNVFSNPFCFFLGFRRLEFHHLSCIGAILGSFLFSIFYYFVSLFVFVFPLLFKPAKAWFTLFISQILHCSCVSMSEIWSGVHANASRDLGYKLYGTIVLFF